MKRIEAGQSSSVRRTEAAAKLDKLKARGPVSANTAYFLKAKEDLQFLRNLPFGKG